MAVLKTPQVNYGSTPEPTSVANVIAEIALAGLAVFGPTAKVLAVPAANQLIPPDPIPESGMYVWQRSIVDAAGDVLTNARVEVRRAEDNVMADLFVDREGAVPQSNPFFVDDEGFARFYAVAGLYNVRAFVPGLERIYENVLLGVRLVDLPNLTPLVAPIIADALEEFEAGLVIPEGYIVLGFCSVNTDGTAASLPPGWSSAYNAGVYTLTHNENLPAGGYALIGNATAAGGHANFQPGSYAANSATWRIFNDENGVIQAPARFAVVVNSKFGQ